MHAELRGLQLGEIHGKAGQEEEEEVTAEEIGENFMKVLALILLAGIVLLLTAYAAEHLEITTKKQSFPEKQLSIERTYRGNQCIVLEMNEGGRRTRTFRINGKTVMAESDEDGDGFFESFMVFDPETEDFEWFTRTTNNVVRPVASEKLQAAKSRKKGADKALSDMIEK